MGRRFTKKRRPKWPMDGLMLGYDILITLRRLTSLTLQQQNREADIKIFFIYEHLAKIWMGHPQHQDLGTRNRIMSWKVCRSSGEKMLESDSSQQVPGSDRMINFILTQKGFLQWPKYELGWMLRRRKANFNRSAIVLFFYSEPELKLVGLTILDSNWDSWNQRNWQDDKSADNR